MNAKIFKKIGKLALAGLLAVALVGVTFCTKTDEPNPPIPQPAKYTINGQVLSQATNLPISGVLVTMGSLTQTTNAMGNFEFANLPNPGKYTLVFTKDNFFSSTYSLEFPIAELNKNLVYSITATMVPYVPGVTPLNPVVGGTISIPGSLTATITIPANTAVVDKNGTPVTGNINITAVSNPDIIVPGAVNNAGISVMRFEPSGLRFNNPLPLNVTNPLTGYSFSQVQLEFFNELTNLWEPQTQPVVYSSVTNKYSTSISHFSLYKISFTSQVTQSAFVDQVIEVTDSVIRNFSLLNMAVTKIRYKRNAGYKLEQPILTSLSAVGITGDDATNLVPILNDVIKRYHNNADPVSQFTVIPVEHPVARTISSKYKLMTSGSQKILTYQFTIQLKKTIDGTLKTVIIKTNSADLVTLTFQDVVFNAHDHGMGGGGTN